MISVIRYHDICMGHRVYGHEGKCKYLHGHNYRFHFTVRPLLAPDDLDDVGRVVDFSVIKERLCEWLENRWDHKMMLWENDPLSKSCIVSQDNKYDIDTWGFVIVPFNPTAENIASYFLHTIAPMQLAGTGVYLSSITINETSKCSATVELNQYQLKKLYQS